MNELEKQHLCAIARKAGFDVSHYREDEWVECVSSMHERRVWLTLDRSYLRAVLLAVEQLPPEHVHLYIKPAFLLQLPMGALDAFIVLEDCLLDVLRACCHPFVVPPPAENQTVSVIEQKGIQINQRNFARFCNRHLKSTRDRITHERACQDLFRDGLMELYHGRCAVTGIAVPELLVASHIKPWAKCDDDYERIDVFNGLLLAVHLDKLFDLGWISFNSDGVIMISGQLDAYAQSALNIHETMHVSVFSGMHTYLAYHRTYIYFNHLNHP